MVSAAGLRNMVKRAGFIPDISHQSYGAVCNSLTFRSKQGSVKPMKRLRRRDQRTSFVRRPGVFRPAPYIAVRLDADDGKAPVGQLPRQLAGAEANIGKKRSGT